MDALLPNHLNVLILLVRLYLLVKMDVHQLLNALLTNHSYVLMDNVLVIKVIVEFNNLVLVKLLLDVLICLALVQAHYANKFHHVLLLHLFFVILDYVLTRLLNVK